MKLDEVFQSFIAQNHAYRSQPFRELKPLMNKLKIFKVSKLELIAYKIQPFREFIPSMNLLEIISAFHNQIAHLKISIFAQTHSVYEIT